jgi:uncharacterized membrane protein
MNSPRFLVLALCAGFFVLLTSRALPAVVASHFDGAGVANGFMSRHFYTWFMLAFVVGLPILLVYVPSFVLRNQRTQFNLPNRDYWLAPERRQETVEFLCRHTSRFGVLLSLLLCYVHWLVIQANAQIPPKLSSSWFIGGLAVFVVLCIALIGALLGRFRKVPREGA